MDLDIIVGWAETGVDLGGVEEGKSTLKIYCKKFSRN